MEKNYFMSGYTGFCPDMPHRIGQNFTESTREAIREQPLLQRRLGATRCHDRQKSGIALRNGDGFQCVYDAMPDYASGYTGHVPTNLWTSCERDSQSYDNARCPLKAYPLSCSEYGSACLDNCCNDEYSVCSSQGYNHEGNMFLNIPHGDCHQNQCHKDDRSSKSSCSSISTGGSCKSDPRKGSTFSKQPSKACCHSCAQGGTCESDRKSHYQSSKRSSRASYSSGSSCEAHGNSRRYETLRPCRFKLQEGKVGPYRKCGVIPNYMGYIPGLHMTFGESYGTTANRLLHRHFNEQENRHF